jgi:hypothetical protein
MKRLELAVRIEELGNGDTKDRQWSKHKYSDSIEGVAENSY